MSAITPGIVCLVGLSREQGTMKLKWQVYGPKDVQLCLSETNQYKYINAMYKYNITSLYKVLVLPPSVRAHEALQQAYV